MNTLSIFNPLFTDSLFDALDNQRTSGFGVFSPLAGTNYPAVDVRETEEAYIMDIELPGYSEHEVRADLKDRVLTISSEQETQDEEKAKDGNTETFLIRERVHPAFVRRFTLPEDINREEVHAEFKNGILTVTIPRKEEVQQRQINIKVS